MADNYRESRVIVALCEGRGHTRGIVGIAAIDVNKPVLVLCQISDTRTYTKTLAKINILQPVEVLISSRFEEYTSPSLIRRVLKDQFPNLTVSSVPRGGFRSFNGLCYARSLCVPQFKSVIDVIREKFYALASTSALITYIQEDLHVKYPDKSIKVEYQKPEDTVVIDIDSANRLELVSACNPEVRPINLLSTLDHCVTDVGRKLLRATILQPPCVDNIIQARLDCVEELRDNEELLTKLKVVLTKLCKVDSALLFATMLPESAASVSDNHLNYALQLKKLLTYINPLRSVLNRAQHPLFLNVRKHLVQAPYPDLFNKLHKALNEEALPGSGRTIRTGVNVFLDAARHTYTEVMNDMKAYVANLASQYGLRFRIHHTQNRGFHIVLELSGYMCYMEKACLPSVFVEVERCKNHFAMTTSEMTSFGVRLQTYLQEIESISQVFIFRLMLNVKKYIGHLYQLCDDVALLDVLQSLATVSTTPGYIRPKFSTERIEIPVAQHPFIKQSFAQTSVPGTIVASDLYNLHIVTGLNTSDKSLFVRQMPVLHVLAHIGCFVPTWGGVLLSCTHLYARIGVEDNLHDLSATTSTFLRDINEIEYLLDMVDTGSRSLIILDEISPSTSGDEGVSVAYTICEQLLMTNSFIIVAIQHMTIGDLANLYYNVSNVHLETVEILRNVRQSFKFKYQLLDFCGGSKTYGINFSRICGESDEVIQPTEHMSRLKFRLYAELKLLQEQNNLTAEIEKKLLDKYEQFTGIHYEIGQVLSESKVPSRTSFTRGLGNTSTATTSCKSVRQGSRVYNAGKQTRRAANQSSSKYLSNVVAKGKQASDTSVIVIDSDSSDDSPNNTYTERYSQPFVPYTPASLPAGVQFAIESPVSLNSTSADLEHTSQTTQSSELSLHTSLSYEPQSPHCSYAKSQNLTINQSKTNYTDSEESSYSESFNQVMNRSERNSTSEISDQNRPESNQIYLNLPKLTRISLNQPESNPIDLNLPKLTRINLNQPEYNPIDLNRPNSNTIYLNMPKLKRFGLNQPNPTDLKEPASKPFEPIHRNSDPSEIICLDSSSESDPKTSNCPSTESSSPKTRSPETISDKQPKETTYKCNLKPAASDYKSEAFPETLESTSKSHETDYEQTKEAVLGILQKSFPLDSKPEKCLETLASTSRKPVTQAVLTKPCIRQRVNRKNQTEKSSQAISTLQHKFDRPVKPNTNNTGKRLQPQNTELSDSQPLTHVLKPKCSNTVTPISKPITRSATASRVQSKQQQQQQQEQPSKVTRKPRRKGKKTQDEAIENQTYKNLGARMMAEIRAQRQRELPQLLDDVKRMRLNIEANTE